MEDGSEGWRRMNSLEKEGKMIFRIDQRGEEETACLQTVAHNRIPKAVRCRATLLCVQNLAGG